MNGKQPFNQYKATNNMMQQQVQHGGRQQHNEHTRSMHQAGGGGSCDPVDGSCPVEVLGVGLGATQ
jgi:hypothetical protein